MFIADGARGADPHRTVTALAIDAFDLGHPGPPRTDVVGGSHHLLCSGKFLHGLGRGAYVGFCSGLLVAPEASGQPQLSPTLWPF